MATNTTNLGLSKPSIEDNVADTIPSLASNFQKIDDKIGNFSEQLAEIADKQTGFVSVLQYENLKVAVSGGYDWQPSIQKAIDDINLSGGGTVLIPDEVLTVSQTIEMKSNVTLFGVHRRASVIKANLAGLKIINQSVTSVQNHFENISIGGLDNVNKASIGIHIQNGDVTVRSCNISNCTDGVRITQQYYNLIEDCDFSECTNGVYLETGTGGANSNQIKNSKFKSGTNGIQIEANSYMLGIEGCNFEALTNGIILNGKYGAVSNCYFESITGVAIDITLGVGYQIGVMYYAGTVVTKVKTDAANRTNTVNTVNPSTANAQQIVGTFLSENTGATEYRFNNNSTTQFNVFFDSCNIRLGKNGGYFQGQFMWFVPITAATATNGSIYIDSVDSKLKFKDTAGVVKLVTLT